MEENSNSDCFASNTLSVWISTSEAISATVHTAKKGLNVSWTVTENRDRLQKNVFVPRHHHSHSHSVTAVAVASVGATAVSLHPYTIQTRSWQYRKQTSKQTDRKTEKQKNRHTSRQKTGRHTDRKTNRQIDTNRQTDRFVSRVDREKLWTGRLENDQWTDWQRENNRKIHDI